MGEATEPVQKRRLGDFEIGREIGRGGMGIVYEARQISLNRKVALKVLAGSLGLTSKAVVRFRREAEAAAKLHHTNIAPIYATGEHEGTHFYAMELIEGPSLNMVIHQMRRTEVQTEPKVSVTAETQTATAPAVPEWVAKTITVGEAEPRPGLPEAVVGEGSSTLETGGGYFDTAARMIAEVADALDYAHNQGVIHRDIKPSNLLLSPAGRLSINDFGLARMLEQPGMTTTGEFMGSPLYMSPEQITAGRAPLDHRTDIYSLGATLYELLTLQPPFPGERRDQIIGQIIQKEPKPPRRVNRKVPVDLETICLKAMEKDPDRRYQTGGQMADDLRKYVNRFAISAKRAGPIARTRKWVRRRPAVAAMTIVVILIAGLAGLLGHRSYLDRQAKRAAEGQRALDHALVAALSGRYDAVESWLEKAEVLDVDPGRIRILRGLAFVERGEAEAAVHELELAVQQLPESVGAVALLGRAYLESGLLEKAEALNERLSALEPRTPEDYLYGAWMLERDEPEKARAWLEQLAAEHPTPAVHYTLGLAYLGDLMDRFDSEPIDQALAHTSAAWTQMPNHPRTGLVYCVAHLASAEICMFEGDERRYMDLTKKASEAAERMLREFPEDGNSWLAAAHVARVAGRREDALELLRKGVDLPGFWPTARIGIPETLYALGKYEGALAELEAMPPGLRAMPSWPLLYALTTAELRGVGAAARAFARWQEGLPDATAARLGFSVFEIHSVLGRPENATRLFRKHVLEHGALSGQSALETTRAEYICGDLTGEALLAKATSRDERSDANYMIGLRRLAEGNRAAALERFLAIARSGQTTMNWHRSTVLLERLREDPTWPPWIPLNDAAATQPASAPVDGNVGKEEP